MGAQPDNYLLKYGHFTVLAVLIFLYLTAHGMLLPRESHVTTGSIA